MKQLPAIFLILFSIGTNAQLLKSNSVVSNRNEKLTNFSAISVPIKLEIEPVRFDTLDRFQAIRTREASEILNKKNDIEVLKIQQETGNKEIATMEKQKPKPVRIKKSKRFTPLTPKQKSDSLELEKKIQAARVQQQTLETKIVALSSDLTNAGKETIHFRELKRAYMKEYYESSLEINEAEIKKADATLKKLRDELKMKADTLAPANWPLYLDNRDTMVRNIAAIYSDLLVSTDRTQQDLSVLENYIPTLKKSLDRFKEIGILTKYEYIDNVIDSIFAEYKKELAKSQQTTADKVQDFNKKYEDYRNKFKENLLKVQTIFASFKPKDATKQSSEASVLADFSQALNNASTLIPGINIIAYNKFNRLQEQESSLFGSAKIFLAATGSDTNRLNQATRLFIPEASNFGFMLDFTLGLLPAKDGRFKDLKHTSQDIRKLGFNFSFYYLQKQLPNDESVKTNFQTSQIQVRTGAEVILIKNALSAYVNLHGFLIGKGYEDFARYYGVDSKWKWYMDAGLKMYLTLAKDDKTQLFMDMRFIPVNSIIKSITKTKDTFIPLIKLGISQSFDF